MRGAVRIGACVVLAAVIVLGGAAWFAVDRMARGLDDASKVAAHAVGTIMRGMSYQYSKPTDHEGGVNQRPDRSRSR